MDTQAIVPHQLYPRKKAASLLGVKEHTLAIWAGRKYGPPFRKIGSRCMYLGADLLQFLEDSRSWGGSHEQSAKKSAGTDARATGIGTEAAKEAATSGRR
jgi:hypothetical protein